MNKLDKTDEFFRAKIKNMVSIAENQNYPKFSFFLDARQRLMAEETLHQQHCTSYRYYGGYPDAERMMLGVYPVYMDADEFIYPIKVLEFHYPKQYDLTHRDFLGAFMSTQIKREVLGDIVVTEGKAALMVHEDLVDYILNNIVKIGNIGVSIEVKETLTLERVQKFEEISGTVASLRIDCILALITRLSRTKVVELVHAGRAAVNYHEVESVSIQLKPQDIITLRGYGKYILTDESHTTKKNRIFIVIHKYI